MNKPNKIIDCQGVSGSEFVSEKNGKEQCSMRVKMRALYQNGLKNTLAHAE